MCVCVCEIEKGCVQLCKNVVHYIKQNDYRLGIRRILKEELSREIARSSAFLPAAGYTCDLSSNHLNRFPEQRVNYQIIKN